VVQSPQLRATPSHWDLRLAVCRLPSRLALSASKSLQRISREEIDCHAVKMASAIQVQVDVHSLRSAQLQIELKRRGLSSSGKKSDLRRRLEEVRNVAYSESSLPYIA